MSSFLDELRFNNIFPQGQGLNPGTPFGMPDMHAGGINLDLAKQIAQAGQTSDVYRQNNPLIEHQGIAPPIPMPHNGGINPAMMPGTSTTKPMDVVWGADNFKDGLINPLDKAKLNQNQQKIDNTASLGQDKLANSKDIASGKMDISQQRADTADFKVKHPNAQILHPKGGNFMLVDPVTHEIHDSGVSTGTMTQDDFLNQTSSNKIDETNAKGDNATELEKLKGNNRLGEIGARGDEERKTNDAKPNRLMLPTQTKIDLQNKAQQLINSDPELGKFIKFNGDGTFAVTPPSSGGLFGGSGPTNDQYHKINDMIYNSGNKPNGMPNKSDIPAVPEGRIPVYDKTGKVMGHIPNTPAQIKAAKDQGLSIDGPKENDTKPNKGGEDSDSFEEDDE